MLMNQNLHNYKYNFYTNYDYYFFFVCVLFALDIWNYKYMSKI